MLHACIGEPPLTIENFCSLLLITSHIKLSLIANSNVDRLNMHRLIFFYKKILILLASIACNVSENATLKPQIWLTSWRQAKYRSHKPPSQKSYHGGITNMDVSGSVGIYQIDKVLVKDTFSTMVVFKQRRSIGRR